MMKSMRERSEQNARRYYDDFSDAYERGRGYGYHQMIDDLEVQFTAPYARGTRVLELGCGTGLILARIAKIAEEAVGIDLSEGIAQQAMGRGLDAGIGSVCDLPFEDGELDLTCSYKVLAHVPDIEGLGHARFRRLRELFRSMNIDHAEVVCGSDYVKNLVGFFRSRERRL